MPRNDRVTVRTQLWRSKRPSTAMCMCTCSRSIHYFGRKRTPLHAADEGQVIVINVQVGESRNEGAEFL